jgi:hypothetical protein
MWQFPTIKMIDCNKRNIDESRIALGTAIFHWVCHITTEQILKRYRGVQFKQQKQ